MQAIAQLFDQTTIILPSSPHGERPGQVCLTAHNLRLIPLPLPAGKGWHRKLTVIIWFLRHLSTLNQQIYQADAVHIPIPSDIGTFGLLLALFWRKPLFVRHCGNWFTQTTIAEHFWKWLMERYAGGRNVMLATGGSPTPPSKRNPNITWIFSTSLTRAELARYAQPRQLPRSPRLIIAARQEPHKGTNIVIQSLLQLRSQFPTIHLDVVGDGSALSHYKQLATELGLNDIVTFHGKVDHDRVMRLLQQANLFTFPTTSSEGFPKAVHEALATGLPVITTCVSVLPELIGSGAGCLLDVATPPAMAQAVQSCLSDANQYATMSRQAIATAQAYSLEAWRDTIGQRLQAAWGAWPANG
jgi:glycosyltransferase involved in cell wall biosynthesis